jgi:hypothetical protein
MKNYVPLSQLYLETSFLQPVPPLGRHSILLPEKAGYGGKVYEDRVVRTIGEVISEEPIPDIKFASERSSAGFSNVGADVELLVKGQPLNIECKMDAKAFMGGTSVRIDLNTGKTEMVDPEGVDPAVVPLILDAAKNTAPALLKFLQFIKKQEPIALHAKNPDAVPVQIVTKEAWAAAQAAGLLKPTNMRLKNQSVSSIIAHYNKKNTFYIQIGGAGLFYLGKNPYNLPVPAFKGSAVIECRLGANSSQPYEFDGKKYKVRRSNGFRVAARLDTGITSPYSLDNREQAALILHAATKGV